MTRQRSSLRAPLASEDVRRFPACVLAPDRAVFRVVRDRHGPWWFLSALDGRFDLPAPEGTCYVAGDDLGAILEIVGPDLLPGGCAPASLLAGRHLRLGVPRTMRLADTLASRATPWVTAEIATITPYAVPQAWARTFRGARWSGVRYAVRHSTSRTRASYALFGLAPQANAAAGGVGGASPSRPTTASACARPAASSSSTGRAKGPSSSPRDSRASVGADGCHYVSHGRRVIAVSIEDGPQGLQPGTPQARAPQHDRPISPPARGASAPPASAARSRSAAVRPARCLRPP